MRGWLRSLYASSHFSSLIKILVFQLGQSPSTPRRCKMTRRVVEWIEGIIGIMIVILVVGTLFKSGIGILLGDAVHGAPGFLCDLYYGATGETAIMPDSKLYGVSLANKEGKLLGIADVKYPIVCRLSPGGEVLTGKVDDSKGGVNWTTPETVATPLPSVDQTTPQTTTVDPAIAAAEEARKKAATTCMQAKASLMALAGKDQPEQIKTAANAVLTSCVDEADIANGQAALVAAEQRLADIAEAKTKKEAAITQWLAVAKWAKGLNGTVVDRSNAESLIGLREDKAFQLTKIETPIGVFAGFAGGESKCTIVVYPPEEIVAEKGVDQISVVIPLQVFWDWNMGTPPNGLIGGTLPKIGELTLP